MATIKYTVWSNYPPALVKHPLGDATIHGGTVHKLMANNTIIPVDQRLPGNTELSQVTWVPPQQLKKPVPPTVHKVQGSRGGVYTVKVYADGRKECTCAGFKYRGNCKHLKEAV